MPLYPKIDFGQVARDAGDLRILIGRDLNGSDGSGKHKCPFHGSGQERSASLVAYHDHFHCFGCGAHGDAVGWVALRNNLSMLEAAKVLDPSLETPRSRPGSVSGATMVNPTSNSHSLHHGQARAIPGDRSRHETSSLAAEVWATEDYQAKLNALVCGAERELWSDDGRPALDWLRLRGLDDRTIRRFRIGFFGSTFATKRPVAGLLDRHGRPEVLRAVRGITIPWAAPGSGYDPGDHPRWVGMNVRRLAEDVNEPLPESEDKCRAVRGSKRGRVYPWPDIPSTERARPILLVEGEFDALVGTQEAGSALHVGTVGGASVNPRTLPPETRAALARCPWLLLGFDHDAAGAEAARAWREAYPDKSRRVLLPHGKDLNEFVLSGGDFKGWLSSILGKLGPHDPPTPLHWSDLASARWGPAVGDADPGIDVECSGRRSMA